jgi:hypothetical protein
LLFIVVIAPFSQLYVPSTLIVPGDATATADNIRSSGWLLNLGIVSDSLVFLIEIVLCVLLYVLFRPVSRTLSLVAAFARLSMTVVMAVNVLAYFTALLLLSGAAYLTVFGPAQLDALALLSLDAHQYGVYIWEAFLASFGRAWLSDLQVGLLSQDPGRLDGSGSFGYLAHSYGSWLYPNSRRDIGLGCWRNRDHWGASVFPLACDQRRKRPTLQRTGPTAALGHA